MQNQNNRRQINKEIDRSQDKIEEVDFSTIPTKVFQRDPWNRQKVISTLLLDKDRGQVKLPKEGGIEVYFVGDAYPINAFFTPECQGAGSIVKRCFLNEIRFLVSSPIRYLLPILFLLPTQITGGIIWSKLRLMANFSHHFMERWYWKPQYFCRSGREIHRVGMKIAQKKDGWKQKIIRLLVMAICMIWDQDDPYRLRGQDFFGILNKEKLIKNPGKEISRAFGIMLGREVALKEMEEKWNKIAKLLAIGIRFSPPIRNLVREIVSEINLDELKLAQGDWYRCLLVKTYNYKGMSFEERVKIRAKIDIGFNKKTKTNG